MEKYLKTKPIKKAEKKGYHTDSLDEACVKK